MNSRIQGLRDIARFQAAASRFFSRKIVVVGAFTAAHALYFGLLRMFIVSGTEYGDVAFYRQWAAEGVFHGVWAGVQMDWVYPPAALLPMVAALALGPHLFTLTWMSLCTLLNLAAVLSLLNNPSSKHPWRAAYLWIICTAILGPVVFSRIDGMTGPLVVVGLLAAAARPFFASALLTLGAWMKIWPVGSVLALLVTHSIKRKVLLAGATVTGTVGALVIFGGGAAHLFGFLGAQSDRGLQVEAPLATPALWEAAGGGSAVLHANEGLNTIEIQHGWASAIEPWLNPLLAVSVLLVAGLIVVAQLRQSQPFELLLVGTLAFTASMIVFNKVGSPQFMIWLVAVIPTGIAVLGWKWRTPAILLLLVCAATTFVFPFNYQQLLHLDAVAVGFLSARNVLLLGILSWAYAQLVRMCRKPQPGDGDTARSGRSGMLQGRGRDRPHSLSEPAFHDR